jgi:cyclopropane fatty-acyl-phospholipid synthase-like methyltransferase
LGDIDCAAAEPAFTIHEIVTPEIVKRLTEAVERAARDRYEEAVTRGKLNGFGDSFHNLWRYYLMYCEGGFRGGAIDVAQVTMVKA